MSELNALELEFLRLNNYNLFVTVDELQKYGDNILQHWDHSNELEQLAVKDVTNTHDEIARPFSRLTMRTGSTGASKCSTDMDKHWRYSNNGSRQSYIKTGVSGNNSTSETTGETLHRV